MKGTIKSDAWGEKVMKSDGTHVLCRLQNGTQVEVVQHEVQQFTAPLPYSQILTPSGKRGWVRSDRINLTDDPHQQ